MMYNMALPVEYVGEKYVQYSSSIIFPVQHAVAERYKIVNSY